MTHNVELKFLDKKVEELANFGWITPSSAGAAGYDLFAATDVEIEILPGQVYLMGTGMAIHMQEKNIAAVIIPRSGQGHKNGLVLGNLVGLIDSDYQGELKISCWNRNTDKNVLIKPYERIAQLVFMPVIHPQLTVVTEFNQTTDRGAGGFGSTGS